MTIHYILDGQHYVISVDRHAESRRCLYTAETQIGSGDRIMIDAHTAAAAVQELQAVLPLILWSRRVSRMIVAG